ncbi:hypothetical protein Tco_1171020 [Tanacetum coccineum]
MRKDKISSKEVVFTKSDVSSSETSPKIPSDTESDGNTQIPLPLLPKLIGAEPSGVTNCLTYTKTKQTTYKVVPLTVKQKAETKLSSDQITKKFLLTLMEEVKGVVGSPELVITKPEAGIFYYNGNFDLVFHREDEFHLATTSQLIRQLKHIKRDTLEAEQMFKKMQFAIKARDDVEEARKIIRDNLDDGLIPAECKASEGTEDQLSAKHQLVIKGLADGKASASNLRDIQVRDIVKEVEDYLKTYSEGFKKSQG